MERPVYLAAFALPPTREKDLTDRQKAVLARWGLPSALSLPPIMPLAASAEAPEEDFLSAVRAAPWKEAVFGGYLKHGSLILAAADFGRPPPFLPPAAAPSREAPGFPAPPLPGFYIACAGDAAVDTAEIPVLPGGTIRTLRLQVLEVFFHPEPARWWRAVRWTVTREEWIKLEK